MKEEGNKNKGKELIKMHFNLLFTGLLIILMLWLSPFKTVDNKLPEICSKVGNDEDARDEKGRIIVNNNLLREMVRDNKDYGYKSINTKCVTSTKSLFTSKNVNYNISKWDMSNVKDTSYMFFNSIDFNQNINNWNVGNVEYMTAMFYNARLFNQPLEKWDTRKVKSMHSMFKGAKAFNQPINNWSTRTLFLMMGMFDGAESFNQPLDQWRVGFIGNMNNTFRGAKSFNQDISGWRVLRVTSCDRFSYGSSLEISNTPDFKMCEL